MKKLKSILSFVFALGIMCLGFSFAPNNLGKDKAYAISYTTNEIVDIINAGECVEKGGAIYLSAGSTYNMSGGEVSGHFAEKGGALYISDGAVFTMTGGTITGNYAKYGGAIYVANGGECYINGGTITGNYGMNAPAIYVETGGLLQVSDEALVDGNIFLEKITPINIYVDGTLSKTINAGGESYTLNEADMPLDYEHCCGYFLDSELRTTIKNDTIDLTSLGEEITFAPRTATASSDGINIYTRTANPNNFTFTKNDTTGTYDIKAANTSISGHIVLPKEYDNVQTSIAAGTGNNTGAFYNCTSITGVTFQNGLEDISDYAFYYRSTLIGELIIPDCVIRIGVGAFVRCTGYTGNLIIPDSVSTLEQSCFMSCLGITGSLTIGKSVEIIGESAFSGNRFSGKLEIPDSVRIIENSAFRECLYFDSYTTIGNNVTSIGTDAFYQVYGISGVLKIPDSLLSLSPSAFRRCHGVSSVEVGVGNSVYEDRDMNVIIEKSTNKLVQGFICSNLSVLQEVTIIGAYAFSDCYNYLTGELIIGDSVTSIEGFAFDSCSGFTSLTIGKNVTSIGYNAFRWCDGVTGTLIIPDSVKNIEDLAFSICSGLEGIYIPDSVTTINASFGPFKDCSSNLIIYTEVSNNSSIPSGWSTYWNYYDNSNQLQVVYGCSRDNEGNIVTPPAINFYIDGTYHSSFIPGGTSYTLVESDMPLEYENCCGYFLNEELTKTIKNDVVDLSNGDVNLYTRTADPSLFSFTTDGADGYILTNNSAVTYSETEFNLIMPREYEDKTVTTIADFAFQGKFNSCGSVNITFSSEITEIPTSCFDTNYGDYNCNIKSINIHNNITSIGNSAFYYCTGFTGSLIIPDSVTSIGNYAFNSCSGLTSVTIGDSVTSIGSYAFYNCSGLTGELIIPDSVTSIGDSAFDSCSGLTSVIIPDSVTSISNYAFRYCSGLTEVKVSSGNTIYEDRGKNAIIEKSTNTIIQGFNCTDLSVLEEVTSIGDWAFAGCSGLTSVTIGDSVTSIGSYAFYNCSGLTSVTIGDSVTSIGNYAFRHCSGLTSVTIPDSVTSIGNSAFRYCSGLTSVYIPSRVTTISASSYSSSPFYNCSSSLVIYTDVANASSKPSGWSTYWNYKSSSATYTTNYGYTLEQYKSAVGLTFAPNGEKVNGAEVEAIENVNSYKVDASYLNEVILEKKECYILPKKQVVA